MQRIRVATRDLPSHIAAMVGAKEVEVYLTDSVTIGSVQWSEGSRDQYAIASLDNPSQVKAVEDSRPWPQNMAPIGETKIPPRFVIVRTGTFCGKPATPYIYANASDLTAAIAAPVPEMTHLEKQVLYCLSAYNSSGRSRFRQDFNVSALAWQHTVESLARKGLATTRGSATIAGKNAARTLDSLIVNPYSELSKP